MTRFLRCCRISSIHNRGWTFGCQIFFVGSRWEVAGGRHLGVSFGMGTPTFCLVLLGFAPLFSLGDSPR